MVGGELDHRLITLDTSAIYAYLSYSDQHHRVTVDLFKIELKPFFVPVAILSELAFLVEKRHGFSAFDRFLNDIDRGIYLPDCGEKDFPRIRELATRYRDMPLGFADASVVACAERRGGRVLTFDMRHFPPVAREGTIELVGLH